MHAHFLVVISKKLITFAETSTTEAIKARVATGL